MKKRMWWILLTLWVLVPVAACSPEKADALPGGTGGTVQNLDEGSQRPDEPGDTGEVDDPEIQNMKLILTIGGRSFTATLEENAAARALVALLPLDLTMEELNGNEKYAGLPQSLPTDSYRPGTIQTGDLMLWGSNTLVLFYETFATSYSYTRLGRVDDPAGLAEAVGAGSVRVIFEQ